jgi:transcriptional regulator with XRE-family HTH domain
MAGMSDELAEVLRKALLARSDGIREIARGSGVSPAQLSRFARGERYLSLPAAGKLAVYLGLELSAVRPPAPKCGRGKKGKE